MCTIIHNNMNMTRCVQLYTIIWTWQDVYNYTQLYEHDKMCTTIHNNMKKISWYRLFKFCNSIISYIFLNFVIWLRLLFAIMTSFETKWDSFLQNHKLWEQMNQSINKIKFRIIPTKSKRSVVTFLCNSVCRYLVIISWAIEL